MSQIHMMKAKKHTKYFAVLLVIVLMVVAIYLTGSIK